MEFKKTQQPNIIQQPTVPGQQPIKAVVAEPVTPEESEFIKWIKNNWFPLTLTAVLVVAVATTLGVLGGLKMLPGQDSGSQSPTKAPIQQTLAPIIDTLAPTFAPITGCKCFSCVAGSQKLCMFFESDCAVPNSREDAIVSTDIFDQQMLNLFGPDKSGTTYYFWYIYDANSAVPEVGANVIYLERNTPQNVLDDFLFLVANSSNLVNNSLIFIVDYKFSSSFSDPLLAGKEYKQITFTSDDKWNGTDFQYLPGTMGTDLDEFYIKCYKNDINTKVVDRKTMPCPAPTAPPTAPVAPTSSPTRAPISPTMAPTMAPTAAPTYSPTTLPPTAAPTAAPYVQNIKTYTINGTFNVGSSGISRADFTSDIPQGSKLLRMYGSIQVTRVGGSSNPVISRAHMTNYFGGDTEFYDFGYQLVPDGVTTFNFDSTGTDITNLRFNYGDTTNTFVTQFTASSANSTIDVTQIILNVEYGVTV